MSTFIPGISNSHTPPCCHISPSLAKAFSLLLSMNKGSRSYPTIENPILLAMMLVSIDTSWSNQRKTPWAQLNKYSTHTFISTLWSKCGISSKFKIPDCPKLVNHSFISIVMTRSSRIVSCYKYIFGVSSKNLLVSVMS